MNLGKFSSKIREKSLIVYFVEFSNARTVNYAIPWIPTIMEAIAKLIADFVHFVIFLTLILMPWKAVNGANEERMTSTDKIDA